MPGQLIKAGDERRFGTDQATEFIGDRAEHLTRPPAAGDQRGHPPQRGLLLGQLTQPRLAGWIRTRRRSDGPAHLGAGLWRVHTADGSPMPSGLVEGGPDKLRPDPSERPG